MIGPDPRSNDDTDELPNLLDAFTTDPEQRASTGHIVARALALLSLVARPGLEFWASEDDGAPGFGILEAPSWDPSEFLEAMAGHEDLARARPLLPASELRAWAATLPDDASPEPEERWWLADAQADAAETVLAYMPEPRLDDVLRLVVTSLLDEHPLVRVAAASTVEWNDRRGRRKQSRRNPFARAILDDALATRSDEVAALAAASIPRARPLSETLVAAVQGADPETEKDEDAPVMIPDAALIHGTWARDQDWWRPGSAFHRFLKDRSHVFLGLYSGAEPWEWSGHYGLRTRLPRQRIDWSRSQAGAGLAWWAQRKLKLPPHLIGHSCGASVAMLATRVEQTIRALVLLSPSVHKSCLPDPAFYRGGLVVRARRDLVLLADGSDYDLLRKMPNVEFATVPRKGLTGHSATHDPDCWQAAGLDSYVRDEWLPRLPR